MAAWWRGEVILAEWTFHERVTDLIRRQVSWKIFYSPSVDLYNGIAVVDTHRKHQNLLNIFVAKRIMISKQKLGLTATSWRGYAVN